MLRLATTSQFKEDVRRMVRAGHDPAQLRALVEFLLSEEKIPDEFRDHEIEETADVASWLFYIEAFRAHAGKARP